MLLKPIDDLISSLSALPGIGKKTATRLAFYILESRNDISDNLVNSIISVSENIDKCDSCGFFRQSNEECNICSGSNRNYETICVISKPQDLMAIENSHAYFGQYHILEGTISPLDGVNPSDLRIDSLIERIEHGSFKEIILALDSTVDGETTSHYISTILENKIKISRIAMGIPFGGELEYTDKITISRAISMRRDY
jgi:recombination protein RecR